MADYYVKNGGNDADTGADDDHAWETIAKVNSTVKSAGDTFHFKRGDSWSGTTLYVGSTENGSEGNYITFRDYGTGDLPLISNPPNSSGYNFNTAFTNGSDYIKFLNLAFTGADESGIRFYGESQHCVAYGCEVYDCAYGVTSDGDDCLIQYNYCHDLVMAVNTESPSTDDRGATGVRLYGASNIIEHNIFLNCIAESYDYGYDGGGIEFYGTGIDDHIIRYNWFENCCGYLEVGSGGSGSCSDVQFHHNVIVNCTRGYFHLAGDFATTVLNFQINNNTFYEDGSNPKTGTQYWIAFNGTPDGTDVIARNNIVGLHDSDYQVSDEDAFTHEYNSFHLTNSAGHGSHSNDATEDDEDPKHTNPGGDDFTLQASSPCIDAGTDLSYTEDYAGNVIPYPALGDPDRGAYEWWPTASGGRGTGRGVMSGVGRGI